jgi:hypothetical protein
MNRSKQVLEAQERTWEEVCRHFQNANSCQASYYNWKFYKHLRYYQLRIYKAKEVHIEQSRYLKLQESFQRLFPLSFEGIKLLVRQVQVSSSDSLS